MKPEKIISGGQSGADRAALDVALELGFDIGGWVPKDRWAEDGPISTKYFSLKETESSEPEVRTDWNVRDSDATLIFSNGPLAGGSALTQEIARKNGKPFLHIDFQKTPDNRAVEYILTWLNRTEGSILNMAGPRQSEDPKIYIQVKKVLQEVLIRI